jgi:hypothetical protein
LSSLGVFVWVCSISRLWTNFANNKSICGTLLHTKPIHYNKKKFAQDE